jgi:IclR family acetate operon transcriptional repressor
VQVSIGASGFSTLCRRERALSPAELASSLCRQEHHSPAPRRPGDQRYIRRTAEEYGLGTRLIEMGSRATEQPDPASTRCRFSGGSSSDGERHVSVLSGTEMMSVANVPGRWTLTTPSTVGRRTQIHARRSARAHCVSASASTAAPARDDDAAYAPDDHDRPGLQAELARVRKRGYAVDNEEVEEGLRCIGAPVRDFSGEVVAAISIAGPVFRVQKGRVTELARAVMRAADDLSADLGYKSRRTAAIPRSLTSFFPAAVPQGDFPR